MALKKPQTTIYGFDLLKAFLTVHLNLTVLMTFKAFPTFFRVSFLYNSYSQTFSTTTFAGKEVLYGLQLQHIDRTKSCGWVLSFTLAFQWIMCLFKKKKKGCGGNSGGYLKQTEVKDDFKSGLCGFRVTD